MTSNPKNIVHVEWRLPTSPIFNFQIYKQLKGDDALFYLHLSLYEYLYHQTVVAAFGIGSVAANLILESHIIPSVQLPKEQLIGVFQQVAKTAAMQGNMAVAHRCDYFINTLRFMEESRWNDLVRRPVVISSVRLKR